MTLKVAAFDSGVGGLTALAPLFHSGAKIEVTYLGDLAHLPYGSKSSERIQELTSKNLKWLLTESKESKKNFDVCLIACNTASAHALKVAQKFSKKLDIPVIGVIEAGSKRAVDLAKGPIVVLATNATVTSQSYSKTLKKLDSKHSVVEMACPLFVPLVEEGLQQSPAAEWIIRHYLDPLFKKSDTAILGCTHYPFLVPTLKKIYPHVKWIDAGGALLFEPKIKKLLKISDSKTSKVVKPHPKSSLKVYLTDHSTSLNRLEGFLEQLDLKNLALKLSYVPPVVS